MDNKKNIISENDLEIKSKDLKNTNNIVGKNVVKLNSKILNNDNGSGLIYSDNNLDIISDKINLTRNIAAKSIKIKYSKIRLNDSYITNNDIDIIIRGDYTNNYEFIAKNMNLAANNIVNNSIIASKQNLNIRELGFKMKKTA